MSASTQPECSVAIQVLPQAEGEEVIRIVDAVIAHLKASGLPCYVGPFESTVEGDFDTCMRLIREAQEIVIREGAPSVSSYVKIFWNPTQGVWSIDKKVAKHHA
ncbi:MAG: thiamine-binding protein [Oscillospiraceae bacterium]|jgi:uncharacterized protein YqgV (UPF0045/DUF77 family)|nr:thiamine-binding protein [Oscillospiraceae bacterium]